MYEIFMDIKSYEGKYQVSNLGNIRNSKGKVMKQRKGKDGYMRIDLFKDGKHKSYLVHRLVLSTFKANPRNCSDVNHIDENKENNSLNNLEWTSHKDNLNYGTRNKRVAATNKANGHYAKLARINSDKKSIPVYCTTNNTVYKSAHEAARQLNLDQGSINKCLKGKFTHTGGYKFEYYKGDDNNGISL